MFGSEILEVAVGLAFVYLAASLVATAVREAVEGILKTRAIQLERGIRQLLDDPSGTLVTKAVFDHPLLYSLFPGGYDPKSQLTRFVVERRRGGPVNLPDNLKGPPQRVGFCTDLPAYIPSGNFALALMHVVAGSDGILAFNSFEQGAMALPQGRLRTAMLVALGEAQGDLDRARRSVEAWYDGTMDRVSGWYKRETSWILFGIGLATAMTLNVDSLNVARVLAGNNTLRQQLIAHVDDAYPALASKGDAPGEEELARQVRGLSAVIGWEGLLGAHRTALTDRALSDTGLRLASPEARAKWVDERLADGMEDVEYWALKIPLVLLGWMVSALAISLGAPFWFDVLNKLMVIRSTVKPYEKSAPEASADRGASTKDDPFGSAAPV